LESEIKHLIIIVGPSGVGKSATAIELAKQLNGEIINCDSRQVYQGFNIGTDKPSVEHRKNIHHHLLDIVESSKQFTAADFAALAVEAINSIHKKNKIPIVTGGTGLYFKALLDGLFPGPGRDEALRQSLEEEAREKGLESLWTKLKAIDPAYAHKIGKNDRMRIIRSLEVFMLTKKPLSEHFLHTKSNLEDFHIIKIGLKLERKELYQRIEDRVDRMFERGLVQEVQSLLRKGVSESAPPFRALGYKYVLKFLKKEIGLEEAMALTKKDTRHYSKRQMTWFRKMKDVNWFSSHDLTSIIAFAKKGLEE